MGATFAAMAAHAVSAQVAATAPGADPTINAPYTDADADAATWVERFERPGRELFDQRADIVRALRLAPGMAVADIGAGTGLYTRLFARAVGVNGRVYAVDISPAFIAHIERSARAQGLRNIVGVRNRQDSVALPPASIDLAFMADTYHHFERPQAMLASIRAALRPRGRLALIDFEREPARSSAWVLGHVRADKAQVKREVVAAGFTFVREEPGLRENYFLWFARADAPADSPP